MDHSQAERLRMEHDELARRLEIRFSVDVARNGLLLAFGALLSAGVSWALLWDRYAKEPSPLAQEHPGLFMAGFAVAGVLAAVLAGWAALVLRRARRLARDEAVLFARLRELRRALELDA